MPINAPELKRHHGFGNPFDLDNAEAYAHWRARKLLDYPTSVAQIRVPVIDPAHLTPAEHAAMLDICRKTNVVVYQCADNWQHKKSVIALSRQFGLMSLDSNLCADDDGISELMAKPKGVGADYIPYSNRPINWHTDGYYNSADRTIRGMVLHCLNPALRGGENAVLDPEIIYIQLRDLNHKFIRALMSADAMTIPANVQAGRQIRPETIGPVFSVDLARHSLHMRYTARTHSIVWKHDALTREAVSAVDDLLAQNAYIFRLRLQSGEGIFSNNVLHTRVAFEDQPSGQAQRRVYRARYYERIAATNAY